MNKSVLMLEHAVQLTPDGHPDKPSWLTNLGSSLLSRFERLGDLGDMNKSVLMKEHAVQLTPDGHPDKPSRLNNLGSSLSSRFQRLGDLGDMNKSVLMLEHAVQLTPDGHPDKPSRLNNLGNSLSSRFKRLGDLNDMNKSVLMSEHAVQLIPDGHPDKPSVLTNLGNSLLSQFERLGDLGDMNKSVLMFEHAVQLTPDGHPDKPSKLNSLGNSLFRRFERLGNLNDMNKSVLMSEHAVQLTPDGHPDKPTWLTNLAHSLLIRFERLGDSNNLEAAISYFSSSASFGLGSISVRFQSSFMWAQCAKLSENHSALDAYIVALQLLPQLAWLGSSISDRHNHLLKAGAVVRDAVAAAIAAEQYDTAIEWLEQGRSIVWGQLLQLRNPVDHLQNQYPHLATQLQYLSRSLDDTSSHNDFQLPSTNYQSLLNTSEKRYHDLAHERDELLNTIQMLPGFETFLLPKTFSQLIPAACNGPVITINISKARCDALILLPDLHDVLHIPLPKFTYQDAQQLQQSLYGTLKQKHILRESDRGGRLALTNPEQEFEIILSQLWKAIVRPILDGMAIMVCIYLMFANSITQY
jgi:tetratricopeptide (TPR) repeat protein